MPPPCAGSAYPRGVHILLRKQAANELEKTSILKTSSSKSSTFKSGLPSERVNTNPHLNDVLLRLAEFRLEVLFKPPTPPQPLSRPPGIGCTLNSRTVWSARPHKMSGFDLACTQQDIPFLERRTCPSMHHMPYLWTGWLLKHV